MGKLFLFVQLFLLSISTVLADTTIASSEEAKEPEKVQKGPLEHELILGSYTYHIISKRDTAKRYEHKVSDNGRMISNPLIAYARRRFFVDDSYRTYTFMIAEDSIGSTTYGATFSFGKKYWDHVHFGIIAGGYIIRYEEWDARDVDPFAFDFGTYGLVPVMGIELNFQYYVTEKFFVKQNNVVTPILTNHTIGLGMTF